MRFSRAWMEPFWFKYRVTPARLDMLIVIGQNPYGVAQVDVRRTLDLSPPVVTRMLDSLEELGYVVRAPYPADRRVNLLLLTVVGQKVLARMTEDLLYDGFTEYAVRAILSPDPSDDRRTDRVLARTRRFLLHLRNLLLDRSTLVYPTYTSGGDRAPEHRYRYREHVYTPPRRRRPRPASARAAPPSNAPPSGAAPP